MENKKVQGSLSDGCEQGATTAYYGRHMMYPKGLTKEQEAAYWNGYNDEPYGRKDYGYEEDRE